MRTLLIAVMIAACAGNAIAQPAAPPPKEDDPNNWGERLGLRIGYVGTPSKLNDAFGGGVNVALHWIQGIREPFGVSFSLGAFAMGSTGRDDLTLDFLGTNVDDVSLRIINFSVGPSVELMVNDRTRFHASARAALYTLTLFITQGLNQGDPSDNHVGVNGTVGAIYRLSKNWFVDTDIQVHKFWTSNEPDDIFYAYSQGDRNPVFYAVNVGLMVRLF